MHFLKLNKLQTNYSYLFLKACLELVHLLQLAAAAQHTVLLLFDLSREIRFLSRFVARSSSRSVMRLICSTLASLAVLRAANKRGQVGQGPGPLGKDPPTVNVTGTVAAETRD